MDSRTWQQPQPRGSVIAEKNTWLLVAAFALLLAGFMVNQSTTAFFTDTRVVSGNNFITASVALNETPFTAFNFEKFVPGDVFVRPVTVTNSTASNQGAINVNYYMTIKDNFTTCSVQSPACDQAKGTLSDTTSGLRLVAIRCFSDVAGTTNVACESAELRSVRLVKGAMETVWPAGATSATNDIAGVVRDRNQTVQYGNVGGTGSENITDFPGLPNAGKPSDNYGRPIVFATKGALSTQPISLKINPRRGDTSNPAVLGGPSLTSTANPVVQGSDVLRIGGTIQDLDGNWRKWVTGGVGAANLGDDCAEKALSTYSSSGNGCGAEVVGVPIQTLSNPNCNGLSTAVANRAVVNATGNQGSQSGPGANATVVSVNVAASNPIVFSQQSHGACLMGGSEFEKNSPVVLSPRINNQLMTAGGGDTPRIISDVPAQSLFDSVNTIAGLAAGKSDNLALIVYLPSWATQSTQDETSKTALTVQSRQTLDAQGNAVNIPIGGAGNKTGGKASYTVAFTAVQPVGQTFALANVAQQSVNTLQALAGQIQTNRAAFQAQSSDVGSAGGNLIVGGIQTLSPNNLPGGGRQKISVTGRGFAKVTAVPLNVKAEAGSGGNLTASKKYRYIITAGSTATPASTYAWDQGEPSSPVDVTTDSTNKQVTLTWGIVPGMTHYNVYRYAFANVADTSPTGAPVRISVVKATADLNTVPNALGFISGALIGVVDNNATTSVDVSPPLTVGTTYSIKTSVSADEAGLIAAGAVTGKVGETFTAKAVGTGAGVVVATLGTTYATDSNSVFPDVGRPCVQYNPVGALGMCPKIEVVEEGDVPVPTAIKPSATVTDGWYEILALGSGATAADFKITGGTTAAIGLVYKASATGSDDTEGKALVRSLGKLVSTETITTANSTTWPGGVATTPSTTSFALRSGEVLKKGSVSPTTRATTTLYSDPSPVASALLADQGAAQTDAGASILATTKNTAGYLSTNQVGFEALTPVVSKLTRYGIRVTNPTHDSLPLDVRSKVLTFKDSITVNPQAISDYTPGSIGRISTDNTLVIKGTGFQKGSIVHLGTFETAAAATNNVSVKANRLVDAGTDLTALVDGKKYRITSLGTTSNGDWNILAGTSNVAYAEGSIFTKATGTSASGTGTVQGVATSADYFISKSHILNRAANTLDKLGTWYAAGYNTEISDANAQASGFSLVNGLASKDLPVADSTNKPFFSYDHNNIEVNSDTQITIKGITVTSVADAPTAVAAKVFNPDGSVVYAGLFRIAAPGILQIVQVDGAKNWVSAAQGQTVTLKFRATAANTFRKFPSGAPPTVAISCFTGTAAAPGADPCYNPATSATTVGVTQIGDLEVTNDGKDVTGRFAIASDAKVSLRKFTMTNGDSAVFSNYFSISQAPTFTKLSYPSGTSRNVADQFAFGSVAANTAVTLAASADASFNVVGKMPRASTRRVLITGTGFVRGSYGPMAEPLGSTGAACNASIASASAVADSAMKCFGARSFSADGLVAAQYSVNATPRITFSNPGVSLLGGNSAGESNWTTIVRDAGTDLSMSEKVLVGTDQSVDKENPFIATQRLTAIITVSETAVAGPVTMTIINPDGGTVVQQNAFIVDGAPTIDVARNAIISPNYATSGTRTPQTASDATIKQGEVKTAGNAIFVYGSGFFKSADSVNPQVQISGTGVRATSVRLTTVDPGTTVSSFTDLNMPDTVLRVELAAESTAPLEPRSITVVLPDGQSVTLAGQIQVLAP